MIWYPYAQIKTLDPPIKLSHAKGVHLYTEDGLDLIDSVSSWWSVIHGYNHPEMNAAISGQLEKFAHVMLGNCEEGERCFRQALVNHISDPVEFTAFFKEMLSSAKRSADKEQ